MSNPIILQLPLSGGAYEAERVHVNTIHSDEWIYGLGTLRYSLPHAAQRTEAAWGSEWVDVWHDDAGFVSVQREKGYATWSSLIRVRIRGCHQPVISDDASINALPGTLIRTADKYLGIFVDIRRGRIEQWDRLRLLYFCDTERGDTVLPVENGWFANPFHIVHECDAYVLK